MRGKTRFHYSNSLKKLSMWEKKDTKAGDHHGLPHFSFYDHKHPSRKLCLPLFQCCDIICTTIKSDSVTNDCATRRRKRGKAKQYNQMTDKG